MKENNVLKKIWLELSGYATLFRLHTGKAWVGSRSIRLPDGTIAIPFGKPISVGLGDVSGNPIKGAADLLGWTTVKITEAMVGKNIAIFTSVEAKRTSGGKISDDQKNWCRLIQNIGGIAVIANSELEAKKQIESELKKYDKPIGSS